MIKPADKKGRIAWTKLLPMRYSAGCGELRGGDRQRPAITMALGWVPVGCAPHAGPHAVPPGDLWGCRWQQRLWDGKAHSGLVSAAPGEAAGAQTMAWALQGGGKRKGVHPTVGAEKKTLERICPLDRREVTGGERRALCICVCLTLCLTGKSTSLSGLSKSHLCFCCCWPLCWPMYKAGAA